jgi:hypothetical protein
MLHIYKNQNPDKHALGIYTRYLKRGYMERMIRNGGMGIIDYVALTSQIGPPWHMIPEFVSQVKNTDISLQIYFEHGKRKERRVYKTPVGDLFAEVGSSIGDGSEHISKYYLTCPEDYKIMTYIVNNTVIAKNEEVFLARSHNLGDDGVVLGRIDRNPYQKIMIEFAGPEQFLVDLQTDPEPVLELLHAMETRMEEQYNKALESSAEIIWLPDNVTSDLTPPNNFREYLLPYYKKYTRLAHESGKTVVSHYDGKVSVLADMLNESGIDVIESVSDPCIGGDVTYLESTGLFPDKVILPNFPANIALRSKEEIERYVRAIRADAADRPFMLQVSEDFDESVYHTVLPVLTEAMK